MGELVVKQFKVPAPNQEMILASFEEYVMTRNVVFGGTSMIGMALHARGATAAPAAPGARP